MIRYSLLCEHDHEFDSWFDRSAAYDRLGEKGLIECPHCHSNQIRKALMTPQIRPARRQQRQPNAGEQRKDSKDGENIGRADNQRQQDAPASLNETAATELTSPTGRLEQLRELALDKAREYRRHIEQNAEYVGDQFAEEARKIHFNEEKHHDIYGTASADEVRELKEEGVNILPLPSRPEDKN